MLIVRTSIAPSKIHGMGVFTAEPIEAGARVWVFDRTVDQEITADELAALPDTAREIALSRSFVGENGRLILSRDNGVFINHSGRPNISSEADGSIALRDLVKGEELTEDYRLLPPGACRAFLDRPSDVRALTFQHPNGPLWIITRWRASLGGLALSAHSQHRPRSRIQAIKDNQGRTIGRRASAPDG